MTGVTFHSPLQPVALGHSPIGTSYLIPALLLLLALGLPGRLSAQDQRPKIGLVLSGGGAKGFAHIGVLKVLEEAGLRPDFITGTSMGSIVGGLYAMGYTADSLERIALEQDWNRVLTDVIRLDEVIYEEKDYFKNQHIELPFVDGRILTPGGLVAGQEIERLLNHLTLPAYKISNFDSLPIPFRCMAVDLYYGNTYEISGGSLAEAIRSSMAIPSVFTPVVNDTLVLVDGGLIRNFPVEEVRKLGADIVIGVHSGIRLTPRDQLSGVSSILAQAIFLGSLQDSEVQAEDVDYYIEPEILPFGSADFGSAREIIERGERAARDMIDTLRQLAGQIDSVGPAPEKNPLLPVDSIKLDSIRIFGNRMYSDAQILGRTDLVTGQYISPDRIDDAITTLFGTNYFTKITYRLDYERGRNILNLYCIEKGNILVRGTLSYDSYHEAGIGASLTFRDWVTPGSRLMLIAKVAQNHRYRAEFLKYLNRSQNLFLQAKVQYNNDRIPIIVEGRNTSQYVMKTLPMELGLFQRTGTNFIYGLGGRVERLSLKPRTTQDIFFERLRYLNLDLWAYFGYSTLDRNIMPRRGSRTELEAAWVSNLSYRLIDPEGNEQDIFGDEYISYPRLTFHHESYIPTGEKGSIVLSPFAGLLLSDQIFLGDFFLLGSPESISSRSFPFYGLEANEYSTQMVLGSSLGYQYFPTDNLLLALNVSGALVESNLDDSTSFSTLDTFLMGAGLTAGYNSLVGPISLTLMLPFTDKEDIQGDLKAFLSFGYRF